jgi:hypothetical protein
MARKSRFQLVLEEAQRKHNEMERPYRELISRIENLKDLISKAELVLDNPDLSELDRNEYLEQISHYKETLTKYSEQLDSRRYRLIGLDNIIESGYRSPSGGESLPPPKEGVESLPSPGHRPHRIPNQVVRKFGWVKKRI